MLQFKSLMHLFSHYFIIYKVTSLVPQIPAHQITADRSAVWLHQTSFLKASFVYSVTLSSDNCSGMTLCILCAANRASEAAGWSGRRGSCCR